MRRRGGKRLNSFATALVKARRARCGGSSRHPAGVDQALCLCDGFFGGQFCLTRDEIKFPTADHLDLPTIQAPDVGAPFIRSDLHQDYDMVPVWYR
jgi:hypothetical protein